MTPFAQNFSDGKVFRESLKTERDKRLGAAGLIGVSSNKRASMINVSSANPTVAMDAAKYLDREENVVIGKDVQVPDDGYDISSTEAEIEAPVAVLWAAHVFLRGLTRTDQIESSSHITGRDAMCGHQRPHHSYLSRLSVDSVLCSSFLEDGIVSFTTWFVVGLPQATEAMLATSPK